MPFLVDEMREDPNSTKAGRHRPASESPFGGLGSSREHKCEINLNYWGIAVGPYMGRQGGGGLCAPSLPWIRVCMRIMPLCVFVEFLFLFKSTLTHRPSLPVNLSIISQGV